MDMLCRTAACACFMGIITAAADMICPSEKYAGRIKLILSLIFLITLLSGFRDIDISAGVQTSAVFEKESGSSRADSYFIRAASKNVSDTVERELEGMGIKTDKIYVSVDISESGSIYISKAEIYVSEERDIPRAAGAAKDLLGEDVTINVETRTGEENE